MMKDQTKYGLYLATACLALIAGACTTTCATKTCSKKTANPLGLRLATYGKFQDAGWAHIPTTGVKYVFINVPPPNQVEATKKRLQDNGLKSIVMRGDADLSKPDCVDALAKQLATCEKLGVKYMFLSAKLRGADKSVVFERLRKAGDAAKKHGGTICLETHPELITNGDVALQTMKAINHPNVRVNFDTGNVTFYNENTDAVTELKKIIDYVATVEFKDHSGKLKEWNFPRLGKGVVDFPAILRILRENGYTGPITMEMEGVKGVEMNEQQTKKYIEDSVKYINSLLEMK